MLNRVLNKKQQVALQSFMTGSVTVMTRMRMVGLLSMKMKPQMFGRFLNGTLRVKVFLAL